MLEQAKKKITLTAAAVIAVMALVIVVLVTNLTQTKSPSSPAAVANQARVTITDKGFVPSSLQISVGTTVVWENSSQAPHQVAANPFGDHSSLPSLFASSATAPGELYSYTFGQAGEFSYHDELHPELNASIVVK